MADYKAMYLAAMDAMEQAVTQAPQFTQRLLSMVIKGGHSFFRSCLLYLPARRLTSGLWASPRRNAGISSAQKRPRLDEPGP